MEPKTRGLMAFRGVSELTALTTLAELGDLTRFGLPRQVMAFVGLVPSEHSSGNRRQRGAITEAGNAHVRRVLAEAAWYYRFPGRKTAHLQRRAPASLGVSGPELLDPQPGAGLAFCEGTAGEACEGSHVFENTS